VVVSAIFESSGGNGVNGDQDDNSLTNAGAVYALHTRDRRCQFVSIRKRWRPSI
jgi:hypothetical protein